jgi:two-component system phosphate regulon sensor histidine kinase PhoR
MNPGTLAFLAAAFVAVALASAWDVWAGVGLGLCAAVAIWRSHSGNLARLRRFIQLMEAGDFKARLPSGHGGVLEALRPGLESMASALNERFLAAEETRRQLLAAINGMSEGVALCDSEGAILLMNPAFRRLAGFEAPILRRCFLWEAVRDPHLNAAVESALKKAQASGVDLPLDMGRIEGRALVAPVEGLPGGSGGGAVVFLFDRTEERKVERLRSEFVANVSHELRTPLSAIKAVLETLVDGAVDDPAVNRSFIEKALHHSERLEELLADLLTLSKIEEQRRRGQGTSDAPSSVVDAWEDAASLLEPAIRRYRGEVRSEIPGELPQVRMERGALRQVLLNYVENALKYSGVEPKVVVGATPTPEGVEVWVSDQGPGIPEADLPRVFERFFRVEKARTRIGGGSGLGLSIVKHLAENVGGQVGVESVPGKGCRFWVRLKRAEIPAAQPDRNKVDPVA